MFWTEMCIILWTWFLLSGGWHERELYSSKPLEMVGRTFSENFFLPCLTNYCKIKWNQVNKTSSTCKVTTICFNGNIPHSSCTSGKPIFLFFTQTHMPVQLKKKQEELLQILHCQEAVIFRYSKMYPGIHVYKHLRHT